RNKGTKIMTIENGEIAFFYTSKLSINAPITQGEWHKITYVMDTTAGKFIAFVDEEYVGTGNLPSGTADSTRVGVRFTVSSATDSENEDFFIDNLKWYTPDANGACPDYNKDHICDYGCSEPVGVCGDADGDELCDYGCGKIYSPFNDLMHAYNMAVSRDYFVEDDDLTKSGTAVSGIQNGIEHF
ncbi:MAG: hypothetical protein IKT83_02755, partial [Bacteroidaceae bacterium]|nr:hypothetical protein [Bacteroidaceae bacterium]